MWNPCSWKKNLMRYVFSLIFAVYWQTMRDKTTYWITMKDKTHHFQIETHEITHFAYALYFSRNKFGSPSEMKQQTVWNKPQYVNVLHLLHLLSSYRASSNGKHFVVICSSKYNCLTRAKLRRPLQRMLINARFVRIQMNILWILLWHFNCRMPLETSPVLI